MTERLLQFIWQFGYFNKANLTCFADDAIQIISPGNLNSNQGPDFSDAKIRIGKTLWAGSVELHLKTSDWKKHQHQQDLNYKNVILHVVWENDDPAIPDHIPLLILKNLVAKSLLDKYQTLMNTQGFIPCEKSIATVNSLSWNSWKERLIIERLLRKSELVASCLHQNKTHWEETFWWLLARNFGIKVNADAFEQIARNTPIKILAKHKNQIHQVESILFGQAGLLDKDFSGDYPKMLKKEYNFLQKKYQLKKIHLPVHFLRMRPVNFPTIRLAQLAMLITGSSHLFSRIREASELIDIKKMLNCTANDYWHYHYRFDEDAAFKIKNLGLEMVNNIIINTICPVLFAWGNYHDDDLFKTKAIQWLGEVAPEKNGITRGFQLLDIENKNACDSQALLELKNEYCKKRRCLDCGVGNAILKS